MSGKSINSDDKKTNKSNLYKNKKLFNIEHIHISTILVSKKEPYDKKGSFKYYIGHNDDGIKSLCIRLPPIKPLCIRPPPMVGYVKTLIVIKQCLLK